MSSAIPTKITIELDQPRELRWGDRARFRRDSLRRQPELSTLLAGGRGSGYALAAFLWCALVDSDHPFDDPEDLAPHLATREQKLAALKSLVEVFKRDSSTQSEKKAPAARSAPGSRG